MRRLAARLGGYRGLLALVAAAAGLAVIGYAVAAQQRAPRPDPQGSLTSPPTAATVPTTPARRARPAARPLPPSRPVAIDIPSIDVHAPVFPIGKTPDGRLAVPRPGPRQDDAAWYKHSPTPGQPGPAVIEGHVDSADGPSVFFRLGDLARGDRIRVKRSDGRTVVFTVHAIRDFKKSRFPTRLVYGGQDLSTPQLRLVTCSDYVAAIHHHVGNEVVFSHLTGVDR